MKRVRSLGCGRVTPHAMPTAYRKEVLTTGEVARICHVAPRTVSKWFDTGKLRGYRIPGSRDRRIPLPQLLAFMRAHGIPLDGLDGGACRVLILDRSADPGLIEAMKATNRYDVRTAANGFEAGVLAEQFRPHVIILEAGDDPEEAVAICRNIRASEELQAVKVVALAPGLTGQQREHLASQGFDECLDKPTSPDELMEVVEKATNLIT